MKKEDLIRKLTSRKFIVAMISVIVGIITIVFGKNEGVEAIAGAAMVIIPAIVYCIMEGKVDSESVKQITQATADAADKLGVKNETTEQIRQIGNAVEDLVTEEANTEKTDNKK